MSESAPSVPTLSLVVPVYNEQEGLEAFHRRLTDAVAPLGETYEVVYVNDGSADGTDGILQRLVQDDPHVRVVAFARNFGHQWAITAGYDYATGQAVVTLDGDGQHPPELIGQMVARWREGYEVVYTVREDIEGVSGLRKWAGTLAYRVIRWSSGMDLTDQADFRLMDRRAVDVLKAHRERARFVRGLVRQLGFRQTSIPYTAQRRMAGVSSYSLRQLKEMTASGVFNFSLKPLRIIGTVGAALMVLSGLWLMLALLAWAFGQTGWVPWNLAAFAAGLAGLVLVALGVVGEYVGRTFEETKSRPLYIVRDVTGFESPGKVAEPTQPAPPAPPADKSPAERPPAGDSDRFHIFT